MSAGVEQEQTEATEAGASYQPGQVVWISAAARYEQATYVSPGELKDWHQLRVPGNQRLVYEWAGNIHTTKLAALRAVESWLTGTLDRVRFQITAACSPSPLPPLSPSPAPAAV